MEDTVLFYFKCVMRTLLGKQEKCEYIMSRVIDFFWCIKVRQDKYIDKSFLKKILNRLKILFDLHLRIHNLVLAEIKFFK